MPEASKHEACNMQRHRLWTLLSPVLFCFVFRDTVCRHYNIYVLQVCAFLFSHIYLHNKLEIALCTQNIDLKYRKTKTQLCKKTVNILRHLQCQHGKTGLIKSPLGMFKHNSFTHANSPICFSTNIWKHAWQANTKCQQRNPISRRNVNSAWARVRMSRKRKTGLNKWQLCC